MNKKILLNLGIMGTMILPASYVVSCTPDKDTPDKDGDKNKEVESRLSKLTDENLQDFGINLLTFRKLGEMTYDTSGNEITSGNNARVAQKIREDKTYTLNKGLPGEVNWWFIQMGNGLSIAVNDENTVDPADGDWSPSTDTFKSILALRKNYFPEGIPKNVKDFYTKIVNLAKEFKKKNTPFLGKLNTELLKLKDLPENALKLIFAIHNVSFAFRWKDPITVSSKNVQFGGDTKFSSIIRNAKYLGVTEDDLNQFLKDRMSSSINPTVDTTNTNFDITNSDTENGLTVQSGIYEGSTEWKNPISGAKIEIKFLSGKTKLDGAGVGNVEIKFTKGTLDGKTYVMWKKDNEYRFIDKAALDIKLPVSGSITNISDQINALGGNDNGLPALSLFTDDQKVYSTGSFVDVDNDTKIYSTVVKDNMIYKTDAVTVAKAQKVTPKKLYEAYTGEITKDNEFKGSLISLSDYLYDKFVDNFKKAVEDGK